MYMSNNTSQLETLQQERLNQIGAALQEAREEVHLSLDDVADKTLIQPRLLRAIESGKRDQLPEPVYIQGFIKRYADVLGLDGNQFAQAFPIAPETHSAQPTWKDSPAAQLRPMHLYIAYIALITAAISGLSYMMNRTAPWPGNPGVGSQLSSQPASPASTPASPAKQIEASQPQNVVNNAPGKPVRVEVTLTDRSWIRVEVDGKTQFQGILPEGSKKTWVAENELTLRAGNAGGVMYAYNSGQPKPMGANGTVEELTFSAGQQSASLIGVQTRLGQ